MWKTNLIKILKLASGASILIFGFMLTNTADRYVFFPEPIKQVAKVVDPKQLACMAKNIFYEAGHEPVNGQAAVARVVINRISHGFGRTPCSVIYQATNLEKLNEDTGSTEKVKLCQFSWVCEQKDEPNKNNPRYVQAQKVAYEVLANDAYKEVIPKSVLFFHSIDVDPSWPYKQVTKIGNHIFYSRTKKKDEQKS